eukprot:COSAG03_NODE_3109_length_2211_cov_2644.914773_3_plen_65_part_01
MVVNTNKILDEGQNKFIAESKMVNEIDHIDTLIRRSQQEYIAAAAIWDSDIEEYIEGDELRNPEY